jgi:hypothetical protein
MPDKNEGSWLRQLAAEMRAFTRYVRAVLADPAQREAIGRTLGIAMSPLGVTPSAPPASSATPDDSALAKYIDGEDIDVLALIEALTAQGVSLR